MDWVRRWSTILPANLQPASDDLQAIAGFFATFLTTSFDVFEAPQKRGMGPLGGCACDVCSVIENASHLQPKKLYARDKKAADLLMVEYLQELAQSNGVNLSEKRASQLATEAETRRAAAYVTYARWLVLRMQGISDGPSVLALWRIIAWDPRGGVRKQFQLRIEDVVKAEEMLLDILDSVADA